ncbi:MAG: endonuclease, partial [Bacteroidales bacterium]
MIKLKQLKQFLLLAFFGLTVITFSYFTASAQIPSGYYNSATGTGATLKTQLYNIIKGHIERSYTQLWTDFQTTDKKTNGKVWDMYSDIPGGTPPYEYTFITHQCGNYLGEGPANGGCYNREHSFPKSWFNQDPPMFTDLFHLVPTDGKVNGERSNFPYGKVNTPTWTSQNGSKLGPNVFPGYTGTVFEPIDSFKGDFARNYFYMVTRYENVISEWVTDMLDNSTFPAFTVWAKNMLIEWNNLDPVSQKEIDRNNAVYSIQHNRNPYIDHPEYVNQIWGGGSVGTSVEPSNYPANFSAKNFKLQWVDATGTLVPEHYLIRMSTVGFNEIQNPLDGTTYPDNAKDKNVNYGVQSVWYFNMNANTTYYFKLFGYRGSGININYK